MKKTVMFLVGLVIVLFGVSSFLGTVDARVEEEVTEDYGYGYGECGYGGYGGYGGCDPVIESITLGVNMAWLEEGSSKLINPYKYEEEITIGRQKYGVYTAGDQLVCKTVVRIAPEDLNEKYYLDFEYYDDDQQKGVTQTKKILDYLPGGKSHSESLEIGYYPKSLAEGRDCSMEGDKVTCNILIPKSSAGRTTQCSAVVYVSEREDDDREVFSNLMIHASYAFYFTPVSESMNASEEYGNIEEQYDHFVELSEVNKYPETVGKKIFLYTLSGITNNEICCKLEYNKFIEDKYLWTTSKICSKLAMEEGLYRGSVVEDERCVDNAPTSRSNHKRIEKELNQRLFDNSIANMVENPTVIMIFDKNEYPKILEGCLETEGLCTWGNRYNDLLPLTWISQDSIKQTLSYQMGYRLVGAWSEINFVSWVFQHTKGRGGTTLIPRTEGCPNPVGESGKVFFPSCCFDNVPERCPPLEGICMRKTEETKDREILKPSNGKDYACLNPESICYKAECNYDQDCFEKEGSCFCSQDTRTCTTCADGLECRGFKGMAFCTANETEAVEAICDGSPTSCDYIRGPWGRDLCRDCDAKGGVCGFEEVSGRDRCRIVKDSQNPYFLSNKCGSEEYCLGMPYRVYRDDGAVASDIDVPETIEDHSIMGIYESLGGIYPPELPCPLGNCREADENA